MLATVSYNRERAVEYAQKWALSRNPLFFDFTGGGGNCTNFASQCLLAGSLTMYEAQPFGWYYRSVTDRAPAWTGVNEFYEFMCGRGDFEPVGTRRGPFAEEVTRERAQIGDIVQLADRRGRFYHTLVVTGFSESGDILICAQSNDALNRPLSSYNYAAARFLHVLGVNIEVLDAAEKYAGLLDGSTLPSPDTVYLPE